jgi:hypothetical protein
MTYQILADSRAHDALRRNYCDEPILDGERFPRVPLIVHRECLILALPSVPLAGAGGFR